MRRLAAALLLLAFGVAAQAQTFTVTPASGSGPRTATWSVPNGTACQAGGDWTGAKAASGTQVISGLAVGVRTFTLTCTVPGTPQKGSVTLSWQPATQNVDGTAYTDAKDVLIYGSKTNPPTPQVAAVPVGTNTYKATNLDAGTWFFGAKSRNAADTTSDMSVIASANVVDKPTTQPWTGTATSDVALAKPKAPVLTVTVD